MTLVSPTEPGMKPVTMSARLHPASAFLDTRARGVAWVNVSGRVLPSPKMLSRATQTLSPLISVGYEKKRKARAARATLKMFIPVPPKISLTNITEKATAKANIHKGQLTGIMSGISIPLTK